ncbi:MAG TPA: HD domain-containing protein, partial [Fimbriimonadaceae bacterium]|nr:HD domain-containing protein [Fimbriimonadaceae bacterium]
MPVDASHDYSVFEHTLRVVRHLDSPPQDSFIAPVLAGIEDLGPLYLAALLHDVGRQESEDSHAEVGEQVASKVCDRWDVYRATREAVCWLVRNHLEFGRFIRMRDVMHPDTVQEFAALVGSPERLAMLAALTWADVNAVAAGTWTPAHETFMQTLYERTLALLTTDETVTADSALTRQRLLRQSKGLDVPHEEYEAFLEAMPSNYLFSTDPSLALAHYGLYRSALEGSVSVVFHDVPQVGGTDVTVCCRDAPGVLSRILGVLYANDVSIVSIRASTSEGEVPVALDTITASSSGRPIQKRKASRIAAQIESVIAGGEEVDALIRLSKKDPERHQQVLEYRLLPGRPAIIEVQAPRGRGLAFRLSRQLSAVGVDIVGARVGQWAGTGTAAFYVLMDDGTDVGQETVARALGERGV